MKLVLSTAAGLAVGVVYVVLTGILTIQAGGLRGGVVFDVNNDLAKFQDPQVPIVLVALNALLSALVFYGVAILPHARPRSVRVGLVAGFVLAVAALLAFSTSVEPNTDPEKGPVTRIARGWEGWVQEGSYNPAVLLIAVLALGSLAWSSRVPAFSSPGLAALLLWGLAGAAVGVAYALAAGVVAIQSKAAGYGVVLDMRSNWATALEEPHAPVFELLAGAVLGSVTFYAVVVSRYTGIPRASFAGVLGFLVALLATAVTAFAMPQVRPREEEGPSIGVAFGWEGWLQEGGTSPAVHALAALALGALCRHAWRASRAHIGAQDDM